MASLKRIKSEFLIPMMNTELRQIRHVVALARHLNFTKAARELGITQSALTRSIQAIESRAQVRLFDRDRGHVHLTEVGKVYLERASIVLQEAADLDRIILQTSLGEVGKVRIGMVPLVAKAVMPDILVKELVDRPKLQTRLFIRSADALFDLVRSEEIEFCVCGIRPTLPSGFRATTIGMFPLSFLVRAGHPILNGSASPEPGRFPLITSGKVLDNWRFPESASPYLSAPAQIVADELSILTNIAMNSDAIWLGSVYAVTDELRRGDLQELQLPDNRPLKHRLAIYSLHRRTLSPAAKRLINFIRRQLVRLGSERRA